MINNRVRIGNIGYVNRIALGSNKLCGPGVFGYPRNVEAARDAIVYGALSGVELIDTADSYGPEIAEKIIGEALYHSKKPVLVATKIGKKRDRNGGWYSDLKPKMFRQQVENCLSRLRTGSIDLLQLHVFPSPSSASALFEVVRNLHDEGLIREVGLCNVSLQEIQQAEQEIPLASVQNRLSVTTVDERTLDIIDYCQSDGLAFIGHQPFDAGQVFLGGTLHSFERRLGRSSSAQLMLHCLLKMSPNIILAPGTSDVSHIRANLGALTLGLSQIETEVLASETGNRVLAERIRTVNGAQPLSLLPPRIGVAPKITIEVPQQQVSQNPSLPFREMLIARVSELASLQIKSTDLALPGSVAFHTDAAIRRESLMNGTEFLHFHPVHDGSMHLAFGPQMAAHVLRQGWGVAHLLAGYRVHPRTMLIYAPRDRIELEVMWCLVKAAYDYSIGGVDE